MTAGHNLGTESDGLDSDWTHRNSYVRNRYTTTIDYQAADALSGWLSLSDTVSLGNPFSLRYFLSHSLRNTTQRLSGTAREIT